MDDPLSNNLLANGLLAAAYVLYKVIDRCLHSKCKYSTVEGLVFDLDQAEECPATDMEKIAELLKSRALLHAKTTRTPPQPPDRQNV